jgi:hypothetical protein
MQMIAMLTDWTRSEDRFGSVVLTAGNTFMVSDDEAQVAVYKDRAAEYVGTAPACTIDVGDADKYPAGTQIYAPDSGGDAAATPAKSSAKVKGEEAPAA